MRSKFYNQWRTIKKNCFCKTHKHYLGGNIGMCENWMNYSNFEEWAKINYIEGFWLTRLDLTKDYSPNNCEYVSRENFNKIHKITEKMALKTNYKESLEKRKKTCLEKYGKESPQTENSIKKRK